MKRLLQCTCGARHGVSTAQAGQTIECQCGQSIEVPAFRELNTLPPFEDDAVAAPRQREWSSQKGCLFVFGLTLFVISAIGSIYFYYHYRQVAVFQEPIEYDLTPEFDAIDQMNVEESYELWKVVKEFDITQREIPPHIRSRRILATITRYLIACLIGLAAATVMLIASFALKASSPKPRRRR